jgi:hypothetical protein
VFGEGAPGKTGVEMWGIIKKIKMSDQFREKVPGGARWQTTRLLVCARVFAQRETVT